MSVYVLHNQLKYPIPTQRMALQPPPTVWKVSFLSQALYMYGFHIFNSCIETLHCEE